MGRFIGLSKNKGSGRAIEEPDFENAGLVLVSTGTGFVLAGGASLNRDPLPDYINANESINTTLTVTGAFGDSTYTFAWRSGSQFGLSLTSGGVLSGSAASMIAVSVLKIVVTDTKYNQAYVVDITINVSTTNQYPAITTSTTAAATLASGAETFTFAATNSPTEWVITTRGTLPANATINNSGVMTFPGLAGSDTSPSYTFTLGVRNALMPAGEYRTTAFGPKTFTFTAITGQAQYEGAYGQNGGSCSFTWVAPTGVTRVNVMAIGGGGGGCYQWAVCGGHGAGMVWANSIPVTPGSSYTIQVGRGGCWSGSTGGCS